MQSHKQEDSREDFSCTYEKNKTKETSTIAPMTNMNDNVEN